MKLPFYWVDSFADHVFAGNPAGVVPLAEWLPDEVLHGIALETGLPMTAFFVPRAPGHFHLRWFRAAGETEICGHATLATAFILFTELGEAGDSLKFETRAGVLTATRQTAGDGRRFELDFPARPADRIALTDRPAGWLRALGGTVRELHQLPGRDFYFAVYDRAEEVLALRPDLAALGGTRVVATAPGAEDYDFVSRFFSPGMHPPEDAATGSTHCTLAPYWAARLGRTKFHARQLSARGGELWCELAGDRVRLAGRAVLYLRGEISV